MNSTDPLPGVRRSRSALPGRIGFRHGERCWSQDIVDVSLSGVGCTRPHDCDLDAGTLCELELSFGEGDTLRCRGLLARAGDDQLAFRFEPLGPHLEHGLKRLLAERGALVDQLGS